MPHQKGNAWVYRNGIEIGIARVSTGRPGYPTPTGVFTILQKARVHHSSTYDEATHTWVTSLKGGSTLVSRYLVLATGGLTIPKLPDIKGIDSFKGKKIHTARWDHAFDLRGKRVGIIGTGATSVQLVPAIAPIVKELHVYQRTPIWILPKPDAALAKSVQLALKYIPGLQWLLRGITNSVTEMVMVLGAKYFGPESAPNPPSPEAGYSNTKELGRLIYTDYVYPFELAAVILVVAIIAAIALTMHRRQDTKWTDPASQVAIKRNDRIRMVSMPTEKD